MVLLAVQNNITINKANKLDAVSFKYDTDSVLVVGGQDGFLTKLEFFRRWQLLYK